MKDNDKVTLTYGQLKKLVKESSLAYGPNDVIDNIFDQIEILEDLSMAANDAVADAQNIINDGRKTNGDLDYRAYENTINKILAFAEQVKRFDVIAL